MTRLAPEPESSLKGTPCNYPRNWPCFALYWLSIFFAPTLKGILNNFHLAPTWSSKPAGPLGRHPQRGGTRGASMAVTLAVAEAPVRSFTFTLTPASPLCHRRHLVRSPRRVIRVA